MTDAHASIARQLLALEHAALTRWLSGDPAGFLEISAEDVSYFDPFLEQRLDGLVALTAYYEALRGQIHAERFEILNPLVCVVGEAAILTYNFVSFAENELALRWNCSEVYRKHAATWKLVQTHWSFTKPGAN